MKRNEVSRSSRVIVRVQAITEEKRGEDWRRMLFGDGGGEAD
jgi:hypothetical protein